MRVRVRAQSGLTLIELMIAVALTVVIVGIIGATTLQIQKTISVATEREDVARYARGIFTDIEQDLARMVPIVQAPSPPFQANPPVRPLQLEGQPTYGSTPRPAATAAKPFTDKLRILTTIPAPDGTGVSVRAIVEYDMDKLNPQPGGGPQVARFRRHIVSFAGVSANKETPGPAPSVLADHVISFQLEWLNVSTGLYEDPSTSSAPANQSTTTGDLWAHSGAISIGGPSNTDYFTITGVDPGSQALLDALQTGDEIRLELSKTQPPQSFLIRAKPPSATHIDGNPNVPPNSVYLNDRIDALTVSAANPDAQIPPRASGFVGPPMIRATLVFVFGRGPEAETARFSRTLIVPR